MDMNKLPLEPQTEIGWLMRGIVLKTGETKEEALKRPYPATTTSGVYWSGAGYQLSDIKAMLEGRNDNTYNFVYWIERVERTTTFSVVED